MGRMKELFQEQQEEGFAPSSRRRLEFYNRRNRKQEANRYDISCVGLPSEQPTCFEPIMEFPQVIDEQLAGVLHQRLTALGMPADAHAGEVAHLLLIVEGQRTSQDVAPAKLTQLTRAEFKYLWVWSSITWSTKGRLI